MASKKMKPPAAADAERLRNTITATAIGSEHSKPLPDLQELRTRFLARRFAISPDLAILIATLALGEVQA
jgi:hypothetical protein